MADVNTRIQISTSVSSQSMISISKLSLAFVVLVVSLPSSSVFATPQAESIPERPKTELLLPETTVALLQLPNFQDAIEKLNQTGIGKMMADEGVTPIIDSFWDMAESAFDSKKDNLDLEFSDLASLPDGEVTVALIAPRRKRPVYLFIMELSNENGKMDQAMESGREFLTDKGLINESEVESDNLANQDGFKLEAFTVDDRDISFFRHENTLIACTSATELNDLIERWMGREVEKTRPLSANRKFATIMKRCAGTNDLDPEFRFFFDPIAAAKGFTRINPTAQVAISTLPMLGLDSLSAIGATAFLDEEDYESVMHGHMLLTNPRRGIISMLAFKPTDYDPEPFIPQSVASHSMVRIDAPKAFAELTKIVDTFLEPGAFEGIVEKNVNQELGMNLNDDIIDTIDGRISWFEWIDESPAIKSAKTGLVFRLKDTEKFEQLLDELMNKINKDQTGKDGDENATLPVEKRVYREITIYAEPQAKIDNRSMRINRRRNRNRNNQNNRAGQSDTENSPNLKSETPQIAILDDCLVISLNSSNLMKTMIDRYLGDGETLVDTESYDRIVDESQRLLNNELPIASIYSDPKRQLKRLLKFVESSVASEIEPDERNVGDVQSRLAENTLPEVEQLDKYFTPSGGFVTDDDTGLHMLFFSLKQDQE